MFNKYKMAKLVQTRNTLEGVFNGVVVDRQDTEFLSRVKVSIFNLTEGIATDDLPWYHVEKGAGASPNSQASIPSLGSEVVVVFPTDDVYNGKVSYEIVSRPPR